MASLLEHVMINKLGDDLDAAISAVGGDTTGVDHITDYPEIIRNQLVNKDGYICDPEQPDNPGGSNINIDEIVSNVINSEKLNEVINTQINEIIISLADNDGIDAEELYWEDGELN